MAASPSSVADRSEMMEGASSPIPGQSRFEKSFMTAGTGDEDDDNNTKMGTPQPGSRRSRKADSQNGGSGYGKIRHLKKDDGEPLWRADIQYDFLKAIFDDDRPEFTNSYEPRNKPKQCFADLYIDTMSRSSKTSKVLRDKLLSDREAAKSMAMVCLLVNIGRMNTTLNCRCDNDPYMLTIHADTFLCSLPRNASSATNLSRHPFPPSSTRPACLQATTRCAQAQVYPEGRSRRPCRAADTGADQGIASPTHQPGQSSLRHLSGSCQGR